MIERDTRAGRSQRDRSTAEERGKSALKRGTTVAAGVIFVICSLLLGLMLLFDGLDLQQHGQDGIGPIVLGVLLAIVAPVTTIAILYRQRAGRDR